MGRDDPAEPASGTEPGRTSSRWPSTAEALVAEQRALAVAADAALAHEPWRLTSRPPAPLVGGCFVTVVRAPVEEGGAPADAWAAAVAWRPGPGPSAPPATARRSDRMLIGSGPRGPRRARDLEDQVVVAGTVGAGYRPGLLALRVGALLEAAVAALARRPDVLLVDGTGRDHPRRAGLAVHLGAVTGIATVGVTDRPLVAAGVAPGGERGDQTPLVLGGEEVARFVRTRSGARAVVAHAAWRTDPATAAAVVLVASTQGSRTPVPLGEARRAAREARAIAEGRASG